MEDSPKKYDPYVSISDIEVWLNVSYRTAIRRMKELRNDLGLSYRKKVRRSVALSYFDVLL